MLVKASVKRIRTSPYKLNLVAKAIRNLKASDAIVQLDFCHKKVAKEIKQALQTAIANAENNFGLDIDNLVVDSAYVGKSLVMKRMRARARGRSARILKPFSNLYITLSDQE